MFSRPVVPVGLLALLSVPLAAQQMPASQPAIIGIVREIEKPGHFMLHREVEGRWADLNRRHNYPNTYLALEAVSGVPEIWWVEAFDGLGSFGKSRSFGMDNPAYTQAFGKIAREDGDHLNSVIFTQARAVPAASYGTFPDLGKMRVFSILTVQMRPGMEPAFAQIAQAYAAVMKAKNVPASWRAYEVIAGAPGGTFLVFSSYPSWEAVDAGQKATMEAVMGTNPTDLEGMMKAFREGVASTNARFFTVNPGLSMVSKELQADPFWAPRKSTP